jgi:hypothetical protein
METHFFIESGHAIPVSCTKLMKKEGEVQQVYIVRKGGITVNEEDIITVKEEPIPENHVKIMLSTDTELSGFTFCVNMANVKGMTLEEQTQYVRQRVPIELLRIFYKHGLMKLEHLAHQVNTIHLHELLEAGRIQYACDHAH